MSKTKKFLILDLILICLIAAVIIIGRLNGGPILGSDPVTDVPSEDTEEAEVRVDDAVSVASPEIGEWYLLLVNTWNAIPEDFTVETAGTESGYEVDARVKEPLEKMLADCREAGYSPSIISAFRTRETQQYLYDTTANKNDTAVPGHSEHECGLAIDIIDSGSSGWADPLIDEQEDMPTQKWLMENCQNYGFILRYPKDKQDVTGIIYEPWHYRYVGEEHAKAIMEKDICLEEYLEELGAEINKE